MWLYDGPLSHFPVAVRRRLDKEQLCLSPFSQLELGYLQEIGRIRPSADEVIIELSARLGLIVADVSSATVCREAIGLTWMRDPFDRLLAAHATVSGMPLVTKDESIRRHLPLAWWSE
jgi:PIN domain nuclease of toxin-antitoxin system